MIAGATRIAAKRRVVFHLLDADANDAVEVSASRGLAGKTLWDMVQEMDILSFHDRPIYHWHANPDPALGRDMTEGEWEDYWHRVEREFGLDLAAFVEARHTKHGRPHRHRLYLLSRPNGTITPIDHDYRRRELISRLTELATGQAVTAGRHNVWVIAELRRRGDDFAADRLQATGIAVVERPAALSPEDRQSDQRRSIPKAEVYAIVWKAWAASDNWAAFAAALHEQGYRVGMGEKLPMLVAPDGGAHRLAQAIGSGAKLVGAAQVRAKVVYDRLTNVVLPALAALPIQQRAPVEDAIESKPAEPSRVTSEVGLTPRHKSVAGRRPFARGTRSVVSTMPAKHKVTGMTQPTARRRAAPETGPRVGARNGIDRNPSVDKSFSPSQLRVLQALQERMEEVGARIRRLRKRVAADLELGAPRRDDERLRGRILVLVREFGAPTIGTADWREDWRARMAGLPTEYGPRLRWVERLEDGRIRVRLDKGVELLVAENRVTRGAGAIEDAIEPMLAHALEKGWRPLRISGGTAEWRAAARLAAIAAGFEVADETSRPHPQLLWPATPHPNSVR